MLHFVSLVWCSLHPRECRRDDERKHDSRLGVHLDAIAVQLDLPPADGLIRPRARIAAVKLLRRVDVHCALGAVAHKVCIGNVMLDYSPAQNDHTRPLGSNRNRVDLPNVLDNVDAQLLWRRLEGVEVQHVAETAVCQSRAEDRDVVLPRPVVDGPLVVDLFTETMNYLTRRPVQWLGRLLARLLLFQHLVQNGHYPVLEGAIVAVRHHQVTNTIHALGPKSGARRREGTQIGGRQAFDKVFLDAAGRGDNGRHMLVLDQVPQRLAQARRDEIRRVPQEDCGFVARFRVPPGALSYC